MLFRALAVWWLLLVLAVVNGGLREKLLAPRFGAQAGHLLGTAILVVAIVLVAWSAIGWLGARGARDGLLVGIEWLVLTVAFELLAGHYLVGTSWEQLRADYDLARGRLWVLVPATTLLAPAWAAWRTTAAD